MTAESTLLIVVTSMLEIGAREVERAHLGHSDRIDKMSETSDNVYTYSILYGQNLQWLAPLIVTYFSLALNLVYTLMVS
jgi:hypothetical protein